jgi:hypothetical protein
MEQLTKKHDKILVSSEFKIFLPFRNMLSKICLLTILTKGIDSVESSIKDKDEELRSV